MVSIYLKPLYGLLISGAVLKKGRERRTVLFC